MGDGTIVLSERPVVGKNQYDLGIYQVGKEFTPLGSACTARREGRLRCTAVKVRPIRTG
jgi:hypothetical protein